ncbi:MAG: tRNA (adenosine(37)-N6)-dimethylallyltransferase MiaA [Curvibacter sp.]|jgi:tRNA dimethylallyltransferase|nr:tRNA (adenosine(37)-N6)-dimethylallyltransferase MiaA [Curvibacter sp.]
MASPNTEFPSCLAIAGPTASGKTDAALAIASVLPVEIISVDSALVYRGMDVGTAKPSAQELAAVPHHLIDIRDPVQPYSAADFVRDATQRIHDIHMRGKHPLLVGGTMLYFKALLDGIDELPPADASVRAELDAQARAQGWPALHAELQRVDPATATRLPPTDSQRIQRALEVFRLTGRPISSFHTRDGAASTSPVARAITLVSLEPQDRAWLHARIAQRFDAMLAGGLLDEVRRLRARGDLHADLPSMRCVGYRQAWELLDAHEAHGLDRVFPMSELREQGMAATRQLAKRQITWLRSMSQRRVVACDAPHALGQVLQIAREWARQRVS